ncbi:FecCD family ABC transporter permease [Dehalogenimonas etheniformans]|uniref:Iron ABC transporter n=1 Tax=Dehalogenimonas etheniformans TaxID=1536648 RepID=A0A2P5P9D7_9CHLR|nr:iron chelate uptake ABC transporter family permease subunit [Dehalogenimonas etheniformans]PPD58912.1 iron ABC transporter [Dehalogenimonas etheniformans]QNT76322.1 iron chelate uptake ABC transporter family permease subunit [Dehalogenimonas etheniformans]
MVTDTLTEFKTKKAAPLLAVKWHTRFMTMGLLFLGLLLLAAFATTIGSVSVPFSSTLGIILDKLPLVNIDHTWSDPMETIITQIRLPRVVLAGAVGIALSVAGATYQGLFRNPLADPYLIGVAQGAALGAAIGFILPITFHNEAFSIIPVFAALGAILTVLVVYSIAKVGSSIPVTTLILGGVAVGSLLMALVNFVITISGDKIRGIVFWMMGSFSSAQWTDVEIALPVILLGSGFIFLFARSLNIIQLGEDQAKQLGVNIEKLKLMLLTVSTIITAAAVSFVGIIGFVGIIIPHAVRLIWGADYRFLLPLSALVGAIFLIGADILSRSIGSSEIPIGIITALCGAPFFMYLLRKKTKVLF